MATRADPSTDWAQFAVGRTITFRRSVQPAASYRVYLCLMRRCIENERGTSRPGGEEVRVEGPQNSRIERHFERRSERANVRTQRLRDSSTRA